MALVPFVIRRPRCSQHIVVKRLASGAVKFSFAYERPHTDCERFFQFIALGMS